MGTGPATGNAATNWKPQQEHTPLSQLGGLSWCPALCGTAWFAESPAISEQAGHSGEAMLTQAKVHRNTEARNFRELISRFATDTILHSFFRDSIQALLLWQPGISFNCGVQVYGINS